MTVSGSAALGRGVLMLRSTRLEVDPIDGPLPESRRWRIRLRVLNRAGGRIPAHGVDADDGSGTVREPRLYQLIRQPGPIVDRTFEIEFLDAGVEAFAFTFG